MLEVWSTDSGIDGTSESGGSLEFFSVLSLLVEMVRPIRDNSSENWFQADMKAVYTYWLPASGPRTLAGRTVCLLCSSTREASVGKYAEASTAREEVLYAASQGRVREPKLVRTLLLHPFIQRSQNQRLCPAPARVFPAGAIFFRPAVRFILLQSERPQLPAARPHAADRIPKTPESGLFPGVPHGQHALGAPTPL